MLEANNASVNTQHLKYPFRPQKINTYSRDLYKAASEEEFSSIVLKIIKSYGFTDYQLTYLNNKNQCYDSSASLTTLFDFMQAYIDEGLHTGNLVLEHSFCANESYFLSPYKDVVKWFPHSDLLVKTGRVITLVEKFNFNDSFSMPIAACNGNGNVIFTVMTKNLTCEKFYTQMQKYIFELYHIADVINTISSIKFPILLYGEGFVSKEIPRYMKALELVSHGYSQKVIADMLHCSTSAVTESLSRARDILNAKSTQHAIRLAIVNGLFDSS